MSNLLNKEALLKKEVLEGDVIEKGIARKQRENLEKLNSAIGSGGPVLY